ncbi:MAG: UDP-3-O-(3-hydroxymyristoyl)glucosamine N-acyltransferase [Desulfuromonadaceae bacterium]|nr:UDP-3-O-(3-hydroxymyristoyl)glucosamine N-acyltransferase [Desulfuromonadaceae bacterium]
MATIEELARLIGAEIIGDPTLEIRTLAPLDKAQKGDITFLANRRYAKAAEASAASAIISTAPLNRTDITYLICPNPYLAFAQVLTHLYVQTPEAKGISAHAVVADSANLGADVTIAAGAVIGERVSIGSGTIVYPNVVIYADVKIGSDCILHAGALVREGSILGERVILQPGAVIGSDGFGFAPDGGEYYKIPQVGHVILEDDVEIGANTCVDRATMGQTVIARGCKLDNLIQIGHNVRVGAHTVMAAQVGISGSSKIGNHCTFGGQSATAGHITTGDNLTVGARGALSGNTKGNQVVSGVPAFAHREWLKASMSFQQLPRMRRELTEMRRKLDQLEQLLGKD